MDKRILDALNSCVKCGICRSVCPVFREEKSEPFVARGHITLLSELIKGSIDFKEEEAKDYLYKCLLCTTCVEACPNSSPTDMIVEFARNEVIKRHGLPTYKRIMATVMKSRKLMDFMHKNSRYISWFAFRKTKDTPREGSFLRFNLSDSLKETLLPPVSYKKTFLEKYGSDNDAEVAIFPGCLINYMYTEIGDAFVNILNRLNIKFSVPKQQLCCGAPIYASGNLKDAEYLAKKNIKLFDRLNCRFIVVLEPTCASFMVHEYERLFIYRENPEWEKRAKSVAKKIIDPIKFLYEHTDIISRLGPLNITTTYHDPCHLKRTQGVGKQPREFLKIASDFREMKEADRCCGNAGTFSLDYPELSKKIAARKVKNIVASGADTLITGCSACIMQLSSALHAAGRDDIKTLHTLEIIEKALKEVKSWK